MRRADKAFLRDLAQAGVPTVPIIAKADTLTPEELEKYRNHIRETLDRTGIAWNFSREALEDADARKGPPFCVISASTLDRNVGRFWPVRKYPWGRCEALSTAHSDLAVLRKLLLETAYWELKAVTEARYLKYRKAEHASEANPVPVSGRRIYRLRAVDLPLYHRRYRHNGC
jgi:septin family protein